MKILVISNSEWDSSNSFGSTFDNFFKDLEKVKIANIYCREGNPNTTVCEKFLKISDKELVKSILKKDYDPAVIMQPKIIEPVVQNKNNSKLKEFIKQKRFASFFVIREIIWSLANYKKKNFYRFVEEFSPDIIFLPTYSFAYINKMALFLQQKYNLPIVSYMSDDEYSFRRLRFSPIYWLLRLYQSKWSIRGLHASKLVYVISSLQKEDCKKDLSLETKVLTKSADFEIAPNLKKEHKLPLKIVYTGNLGNNRYKSLGIIADALKEINEKGVKAMLEIYTATTMNKKMQKLLNVDGCCKVVGKISSQEVVKVQKDADILVHVEAFDLKNKLEVRQSFSTKIIDYFKTARPILAVGPKDVASIKHLLDNQAALYADNKQEVVKVLGECLENTDMLTRTAERAYMCGKQYHNKSTMQASFIYDLNNIL